MAETPEDYELFHYGVKGMKWGVRRSPEQLAKREAKKTARSEDRKETYGIASKRVMKGGAGPIIVATMLAGPSGGIQAANAVSGYNISRSAGYKRGSSVAIGLLGGSAGGLIASEIKIRRRASQKVREELS